MEKLGAQLAPQQPADVPVVAPAAGQVGMQQTSAGITAVRVQVPRDLHAIRDELIAEAQDDPTGLIWRYRVGNNDVEGLSIRMAEMIRAAYGNCEARVVLEQETPSHWYMRAHFVDYERGSTISRMFVQRRPQQTKGRFAADRTEQQVFAGAESRALRNVILSGVPRRLVRAVERAIKGEIGDREVVKAGGLSALRERTIAFFGDGYGVSQAMLEAKLGKPVAEWQREDFASLAMVRDAIRDGQTSVESEFDLSIGSADALQAQLGIGDER